MANTVRIRNGMSNATEGDILGNFGDLVGVGVVDKANGHLLVTEDSPRGMSIQVAGGIVYVPNAGYNQLDSDTPKFYPVVCDAEALTIDNNTSGQTRNDIVCVKVDKSIFPDADASNIATKIVVKGTSGGGVPATPVNHYKLAEIRVVNGATEIENSMIVDSRAQALLNLDFVNINPTGAVVGTTDTQTLTNKTIDGDDNTLSDISPSSIKGGLDGWIPISSFGDYTFVLGTADDPSFSIEWDDGMFLLSYIGVGMKIKWTQNGTVRYGFITYADANGGLTGTEMVVYGGTDYNVDNTTTYPVSNICISREKAPFGFPMSEDSWSVKVTSAISQDATSSSTSGVVYRVPSLDIVIPLGEWKVKSLVNARVGNIAAPYDLKTSFSRATNSATNTELSTQLSLSTVNNGQVIMSQNNYFLVKNTAKTTWYTVMWASLNGAIIGIRGDLLTCYVIATCAYL